MSNIQKNTIFIFLLFFLSVIFSGESVALTQADCWARNADLVLYKGMCIPDGFFLGLSEETPIKIVTTFLMWLLSIGGFVAVIAFVVSGIQYLVSAGNDDVIERAKNTMLYSIVGVIVMLSGLIIITAIDTWLTGTTAQF